MGYGIRLSLAEREALDGLRFRTPSADVFRNCLILLMSDSRDTIASIAGRLGCATATVARIRRLYRMGGIGALHPTKPPGRRSRATPAYLKKMKRVVDTNPMKLGYGFSVWSATRLAAHMAKETGIHFSDDQMRRLLHQVNYSFHRPKHTLKGKRDEAAYEKARRKLIGLKKRPEE
ncbi:MAG: helix-turn-helix domain-containing protein [Planctomycetes bacterium]|nr:helix-turn-helix domain-containing protein [Planctomycetota bacterium]